MTEAPWNQRKIGWIGTGRMGLAMATRLARAGCDLTVHNRTRARAEPLAQHGARIADRLADLAGCDLVFAMVSTSDVLDSVLLGPEGLYAAGTGPGIVVDCSSISLEASAKLRAELNVADSGLRSRRVADHRPLRAGDHAAGRLDGRLRHRSLRETDDPGRHG